MAADSFVCPGIAFIGHSGNVFRTKILFYIQSTCVHYPNSGRGFLAHFNHYFVWKRHQTSSAQPTKSHGRGTWLRICISHSIASCAWIVHEACVKQTACKKKYSSLSDYSLNFFQLHLTRKIPLHPLRKSKIVFYGKYQERVYKNHLTYLALFI